jgi:hypothetical protein
MSQILVTGEAKIRDIQGPVVANSGVITALDGAASQYVRGDGTLADFPSSTGGGSSVSYYLNSSVSQGTIGGVAYRELSKEPIIGTGTDITIAANGYVANYITDANDPDVLSIPGGNFNCEFYFSVNNNTGAPYTYAELYKYNGTTFTLLGSSVGVPEYINQGTIIAPYYFAIPVPTSALAITDRLAIRIYVNVDGRTVTLHTENSHLCQVVTTLSKGMVSLNNLTDQSQYLTTGTSGTDFAIVSSGDTHTFNLPIASASNTGKLSSTDWSTFNGKVPYTGAISDVNLGTYSITGGIGTFTNGVLNGNGTNPANLYLKKGSAPFFTNANNYGLIAAVSSSFILISDVDGANYKYASFNLGSLTNNTNRAFTLPDLSGTIALTSDINYPVTSVFGRTGAVVAVSGDYNTDLVTEGSTNLYFTNARSRGALSFTAGSGAYNSTTGVITIPTNNNQITNGAGYITSSALSGYLPLSGGTLTGGLNGTTATFSGLGTFYQLTMTGATAGRLFYAQTGGVFSQSGNLVWNNSTEMLGVGTPNPSAVVTAFSTNAATQLKAAGTAPAITFSNTLTSASLACVFGLATANNHFVTGTAAGDMAIANQSTSPGAIIFGTGTFEKMRMTAAGTFSIGNTNSTYNLDVTGTGRFTSTLLLGGALSGTSATFSGKLTIGSSSVAEGEIGIFETGGNYNFTTFKNGTVRTIIGSQSSTSQGFIGTVSNHDLLLKTNDTTRLTIASTGAATFSSSVTASNFTSDGSQFFSFTLKGRASDNYGAFGFYSNNGATRYGYIQTHSSNGGQVVLVADGGSDLTLDNRGMLFNTSSTERMRITSGGNVGIGTSSPNDYGIGSSAKVLQVTGSSYGIVNATAGSVTAWIIADTAEAATGTSSNHPFKITTNNVERMRITSGGFTKMTSTGSVIDANGTYHEVRSNSNDTTLYVLNQAGAADGVLVNLNTNGTTYNFFRGYSNAAAANRIIIYTNGNVVNANGSYGAISDIKLKENITDTTPKLKDLLKVKVRNYNFKNTDNKQIGVIAQELEEIFPSMIDISPDRDSEGNDLGTTTKSVKYSVFVPMLIKAIQEQTQIIKDLESRIVALESK